MKQRATHHQAVVRSSITRKGQVTIPATMRRRLNLRQGDEVAFELADEEIRLTPATSRIAALYGSLSFSGPSLTAEELRDVAATKIAEEGVRRNS